MKQIVEYVNSIDNSITVEFDDEETFYLGRDDWKAEAFFSLDKNNVENTLTELKEFLSYKYIENVGIINENYAEISIGIANQIFIEDVLNSGKYCGNESEGEIYYSIGEVTDQFERLIETRRNVAGSGFLSHVTTLKIYNLSHLIKEDYKSDKFQDVVFQIAKCILFELSSKYAVDLSFVDIPDIDDYDDDLSFDDKEKLAGIDVKPIKFLYDNDLLSYYYRAVNMSDSEFKYIAFYQVMECIFDEVYLSENIQDIKQIINSNCFSSYNDSNLMEVIKVIEQYDKNKNDREKLKLVLEKYFRGNIHDDAYYIANKDISKLLIDMKKIKSEKELKDLQQLTGIIYDYRCKCTHSNRAFPVRTSFLNTSSEQANYIELIKLVAERIIKNYNVKSI